MPDKVSILSKTGVVTYYSTYSAARAAANPSRDDHDLIQIWADLNETIILSDKVDIWIMPGVEINNTYGGATITDNNVAVICNIYGEGIIKNTRDVGTTWYECIKISNANTEISIECDYIEGIGGTTSNSLQGPCIYISNGKKFHLKCNKVYNQRDCGIYIGGISYVISDINLNIQKIETGSHVNTTYYGESALITHGNGFIKIDEIVCSSLGHCFSHRGGKVISRINKMTTILNINFAVSTVHMDQGTGLQELILYFDEIISSAGVYNANLCIEQHQGKGIFIGRKIISNSNNFPNYIPALQISSSIYTPLLMPTGFMKINEIISKGGLAMILNDFTEQITIDSNNIECNGGAVISSNSTAVNYLLKNATLRNLDTSSGSKGIALDGNNAILTFNNIKIIAGGNLINLVSGSISIKNYGLFGNKNIDNEHIILEIGDINNFVFIYSNDLT